MKKFQPRLTESPSHLANGTILIAKPLIPDEAYRRTVVMIVHHDEYNTTGLILNRPSAVHVDEVFDILPVNTVLNIGGPVESHLVTFVHDIPDFDEALSLGNGLFWGGSHDYLEKKIVQQPEIKSRLRFYAGITSWNAGELENELNTGYWWAASINPSELFNDCIPDLRSYLLLREENLFGVLNDVPDPVLN